MGYGYAAVRLDRLAPAAGELDAMDEVCSWLGRVENRTVRRIVGMRMVWDAQTGRYAWTFRRIGSEFGCLPVAVRVWHGTGLRHLATVIPPDRLTTMERVWKGWSQLG